EGLVVRPADAREEGGQRRAFGGEGRAGAEGPDAAPHERAGRHVSDEGDEVALRRIEAAQRGGVLLAARRVAEAADRLEAQHRHDVLVPLAAAAGVDAAA